jgi:predicted O-linked N-acetylglucosamine transferase (SPINDLY family)
VVTLPSSQTVVQLAAGFFRYIGVTDCIAKDEEDFINMAVEFANNKELRERVSEKIIQGHGKLYEDEYTLDEWNTFLASV